MANDLVASFVLRLKDQLSGGVVALTRQLRSLRDIAQAVKLSGLAGADRLLDKVGAGADRLRGRLDTAADSAARLGRELRAASGGAGAGGGFARVSNEADAASASVGGLHRALGRLRTQTSGGVGAATARVRQMRHSSFVDTTASTDGGGDGGGSGGGFGVPPSGRDPGRRFNIPRPNFKPVVAYGRSVGHALHGFGDAAETAGSKALAAAATGFGLIEPVEHYAEFDREIRQSGVDQHLDAGQMDAFARDQRRKDYALALRYHQSSRALARSAHYLALSHMKQPEIDALQPTLAAVGSAFGIGADEVAPTAFHLSESLGIKPQDMKTGLARVARASTMSHLNFGQLSEELPALLVNGAATGLKGEEGLDRLLSYLVVSKNNAATVGEAATNLGQFMAHIREPITTRAFKEHGVDLKKVLKDAQKNGVDPIRAVIDQVRTMTKGMNEIDRGALLGALFRNVQAAQFLNGAIGDTGYGELDTGHKEIASTSSKEVDRDVKANLTGVSPLLTELREEIDQLSDRFARGFVPVLRLVSGGLKVLIFVLNLMDHILPGSSDIVTGLVGAMLALGTAIGLLGVATPFLKAGWSTLGAVLKPIAPLFRLIRGAMAALFTPMGGVAILVAALAAVFIAAALDIYRHWDRFRAFFGDMGRGVMSVLRGLGEFLAGVFTLDSARAVAGLMKAWSGLKGFFGGLWNVVRQLFTDFTAWVDSWSGGLGTRIIAGIKGSWHFLVDEWQQLITGLSRPFDELLQKLEHPFGGSPQLAAAGAAQAAGGAPTAPASTASPAASRHTIDGTITVAAAPGSQVVRAASSTPGVGLMSAGARGPMTSRP